MSWSARWQGRGEDFWKNAGAIIREIASEAEVQQSWAEREWWETKALDADFFGHPHYPVHEVAAQIAEVIHRRRPNGRGMFLDLGCGPGRLTLELAGMRLSDTYNGCDPARQAISRAEATNDRRSRAFFKVMDQPDVIPFPSDLYDAVFSVTVFQHLDDDVVENLLDEVFRVLVVGGLFVFTFATGDDDRFLNHQRSVQKMTAMTVNANLTVLGSHGDDRGWRWMVALKEEL